MDVQDYSLPAPRKMGVQDFRERWVSRISEKDGCPGFQRKMGVQDFPGFLQDFQDYPRITPTGLLPGWARMG